jgi:hypothetical protein
MSCQDCAHFQPNDYPFLGWGQCARITDEETPERLAIAWDYEGYSAGIYVSPAFGCVLWTAK